MQPNYTNSEQNKKESTQRNYKNHPETWIAVYSEVCFDDSIQKDKEINEIISNTETELKDFNNAIEEKRKAGIHGKDLLEFIDQNLDKVSNGLTMLEAYTKLELNALKLEFLEKEKKELEEKITQIEDTVAKIEWEEQLREVRLQQYTLCLKELYRAEQNLPPELLGKKLETIEQLAKLKVTSYEDIENLPYIQREQVEAMLLNYHYDLLKNRQTVPPITTLGKSKDRYKRFSELNKLSAKKNNLTPEEQIKYLNLLETGILDIQSANTNQNFLTNNIAILAQAKGITPEYIDKENIIEVIKNKKNELIEKLNSVNNTKERERITKEESEKLQKELSDQNSKISQILEIVKATDFSQEISKINEQIEKNRSEDQKHVIAMIEETIENRLKTLEKNNRENMEKSLDEKFLAIEKKLRDRMVDEMSNLSALNAAKTNTSKELNENTIAQIKDEIEKKTNFILTELKSEIGKTQIQPSEFPKLAEKTSNLEKALENIKEKYVKSAEIVSQIGNPATRDQLIDALKTDTKLARLRSEISTLDKEKYETLKTELNKIPLFTSIDTDRLLAHPVFDQNEEFQQIRSNLAKSYSEINKLFNEGNFQLVPTPNGILIGFRNPEDFAVGVMGRDTAESMPDTIAVKLKSADATKNFAKAVLKNGWDGNVSTITSKNGPEELLKQAQESMDENILIESSKPQEAQIKNRVIEKVADSIANGEITKQVDKPEKIDQIKDKLKQKLENLPEEDQRKFEQNLDKLLATVLAITLTETQQEKLLPGVSNIKQNEQKISEAILNSTQKNGEYDIEKAIEKIQQEIINSSGLTKTLINSIEGINNRLNIVEEGQKTVDEKIQQNKENIEESIKNSEKSYQSRLEEKINENKNQINYALQEIGIRLAQIQLRLDQIQGNILPKEQISASDKQELGNSVNEIENETNRVLKKIDETNPENLELKKQVEELKNEIINIKNSISQFSRKESTENVLEESKVSGDTIIASKKVEEESKEELNPEAKENEPSIQEEIRNLGKKLEFIGMAIIGNQELIKHINKDKREENKEQILPEEESKQTKVEENKLEDQKDKLISQEEVKEEGTQEKVSDEDKIKVNALIANFEKKVDELAQSKQSDPTVIEINKKLDSIKDYIDKTSDPEKLDQLTAVIKNLEEKIDAFNQRKENVKVTEQETVKETSKSVEEEKINGTSQTSPEIIEETVTTQKTETTTKSEPVSLGKQISQEKIEKEQLPEKISKSETILTQIAEPEKKQDITQPTEITKTTTETISTQDEAPTKLSELKEKAKEIEEEVPIQGKMAAVSTESQPEVKEEDIETIEKDKVKTVVVEKSSSDPILKEIGEKLDELETVMKPTEKVEEVKPEEIQKYESKVPFPKLKKVKKEGEEKSLEEVNKEIEEKTVEETKKEGEKEVETKTTETKEVKKVVKVEGISDRQLKIVEDYYKLFDQVNEQMKKTKNSKNFWGNVEKWIQRIGGFIMGLSVVGAFFTGNPFWAGTFFLTAGIQAVLVYEIHAHVKIMGARNKVAQAKIGELYAQKGNFDALLKGPVADSDLDKMENLLAGLKASVSSIGEEPIPRGSFPKDDEAIKVWSKIFGEKGLMVQGIKSMQSFKI